MPEIESELMVTGAEPLEVKVTDFVTAVPTETLPKESELALALRTGVAALSCSAKLCAEEFALADRVAVCEVVTEEAVAVNEAEDAPEATVTLAGTVTAVLLLASVTTVPPVGAAELKPTVHVVDPAPVNVPLPQERALTVGVETEEEDAELLRLIDVDFEDVPCVAVNVAV